MEDSQQQSLLTPIKTRAHAGHTACALIHLQFSRLIRFHLSLWIAAYLDPYDFQNHDVSIGTTEHPNLRSATRFNVDQQQKD
jgi:hypothetical protein